MTTPPKSLEQQVYDFFSTCISTPTIGLRFNSFETQTISEAKRLISALHVENKRLERELRAFERVTNN